MIEQIIALMPDWDPYFYRTSNGAELDLLMLKGNRLLAFEIKASVAPKLTKGFHTAREDIQPQQTFLVSRNNETWTSSHGVVHTNVQDLPNQLASYLS